MLPKVLRRAPRCCPKGWPTFNGGILMPSYVNIGAYVDEGSMVDTWATVAAVHKLKNVHRQWRCGYRRRLEPLQAAPVIIEDNVFVGSRCIVVEGVRVEKEAVLVPRLS